MTDKKTLTTNAGAPVVDNQNTLTAGPRGPMLLQDVWYLEKLAYSQTGKLFRLMSAEQQTALLNTARAMGDAPREIKIRPHRKLPQGRSLPIARD